MGGVFQGESTPAERCFGINPPVRHAASRRLHSMPTAMAPKCEIYAFFRPLRTREASLEFGPLLYAKAVGLFMASSSFRCRSAADTGSELRTRKGKDHHGSVSEKESRVESPAA